MTEAKTSVTPEVASDQDEKPRGKIEATVETVVDTVADQVVEQITHPTRDPVEEIVDGANELKNRAKKVVRSEGSEILTAAKNRIVDGFNALFDRLEGKK